MFPPGLLDGQALPSELAEVMDNLRQSADTMQPATQLLMECFMSYFKWAAAGGQHPSPTTSGMQCLGGMSDAATTATTTPDSKMEDGSDEEEEASGDEVKYGSFSTSSDASRSPSSSRSNGMYRHHTSVSTALSMPTTYQVLIH